jgi:hypothetical protein
VPDSPPGSSVIGSEDGKVGSPQCAEIESDPDGGLPELEVFRTRSAGIRRLEHAVRGRWVASRQVSLE